MSRTDFLQNLADELRADDQVEFAIAYLPGIGWWGTPTESRHFGDEGEFLGENWQQAEKTLRFLLG